MKKPIAYHLDLHVITGQQPSGAHRIRQRRVFNLLASRCADIPYHIIHSTALPNAMLAYRPVFGVVFTAKAAKAAV